MNEVHKSERKTQDRLIPLFVDELDFDYLNDWQKLYSLNHY